jgi:hypothetical protein
MTATNFLSTIDFISSCLQMTVLQGFCRLYIEAINLKSKRLPFLTSLVLE